MKNQLRSLIAFLMLAVTTIPASAIDYTISFTASGAATTISSVEVQNLTQNTSVVVPAGAPVTLTVSTAAPYLKANSLNLKIYPNPMTEKSIVSFYSEFGGKTDIAVYGMDGRTVIRTTKNLEAGTNQFRLSMPQGVFTLHITENGILHIGTIISQTMNKAELELSGTEPTAAEPIQKVKVSATALGYTAGDNLLLKGYSGDFCTIITIKPPTKDTTINFNFVECRDADGYNYPVVQIGNQTWMAENLKTTKYRNGDLIGTTTPATKDISTETEPKHQWAYNGDENNVAKYGRLYTWYAATDSRKIAPEGWHLPSNAEWTILENYLKTIDNKIAKSLAATTDWNTYTTTGTIGNDLTKNNSSGFTALPGGRRSSSIMFNSIGSNGAWWSSTDDNTMQAWYKNLNYNSYVLNSYTYLMSLGISVRCLKNTETEISTITTCAISNITLSSATCGGNITYDGGSPVTERGVCWNTTGNPTIIESKTSDGTGTGSFTSEITGLTAGAIYYIRAYATNTAGTSYGGVLTFFTGFDNISTFTDLRDGNVYKILKIGNQVWMAENLRYLPTIAGPGTGSETIPHYYVHGYDGTDVTAAKATAKYNNYGVLYNWEAAKAAVPAGWHLPTDAEWTILENYLIANGGNYDGTTTENKIAKSLAATTDWEIVNSTGNIGDDLTKNNSSGFSALPGGIRDYNGTFSVVGSHGLWWSSSESNASYAWFRALYYNSDYLSRYVLMKSYGFSVRCVRD